LEEKLDLARAAAREAKPRASGWWRGACPFCVPARPDPTFSIQPSTGHWHCFRCHTGGSLEADDDALQEAVKTPPPDDSEARRPPDGFLPLGEGDGLRAFSAKPARAYLQKRGVSPETARKLQIGCVLGSGRHAGRVVVPVLVDGNWRGWVARDFTGKAEKKYLNARGNWRGDVLFGADALRRETETPVMITEGVFDALPFVGDAVAVLGKPTEEQLWIIKTTARRPVAVVLDGDAHEEGWALAMKLRLDGIRAGSVRLPPKKDPDQVDRNWLFEEARRVISD
jgi:DNA primase